jgi:Tol biopolymer transport system component
VRTESGTYQVIAGPITVDGSTQTVSATAVGRGTLVVKAEGIADTSHVRVVPQGALAAYRTVEHTGQAAEVVMFNLDGSGYRRLATTSRPGYFTDVGPRWNPAGTQLVYHDGSYDKRLFVVDTLGSSRRLITTSYGAVSESWAQYSRDGSWVYDSGRPDHQNTGLWRVRADGSSPEPVGPEIGWYDVDANPSPSPDGKRTDATITGSSGLRMKNGSSHARPREA